MRNVVLALSFLLVVLGCAKKEPPKEAPAAPGPADAASAAPATVAKPASLTVSGVVQETMGTPDYTYMRLKTADGEIWAAVTKAGVRKGQDVTVVDAMPMDGFESKTLSRKFDRIVFGTLAGPAGAAPATSERAAVPAAAAAAPMAAGHESADMAKAREAVLARHAAAAAGPADVGKIDVKKAGGSDGKSVAEVFAAKAGLSGKTVAVRGKVVKYTPGVMGKNWIHLRDGSGSRGEKNDDITVTTVDATALGEVVLVTGTVKLDVDFGAGYAYPVLIENAKVSK